MSTNKKLYAKFYDPTVVANNFALDFEGNSGSEYIGISNTSKLQITGNITIEAWIKPESFSDFNMVVTKTTTSPGSNNTYELRLEETTGHVQFLHFSGSTKTSTLTQAPPLGVWSHIVATKDGSDVAIFLNGSKTEFSGNGGTSTNNSFSLLVGARRDLGSNFFNGSIAEVRLWNDVRTDEEILENMHKPLTGSESNLAGYWKLNEGSGTTANDSSSSPQDGTLLNFSGTYWFEGDEHVPPVYEEEQYKGFLPRFNFSQVTQVINGGVGELTLTIPRPFDNFNQSDLIKFNNRVELVEFDKDNQSGTTIYNGYIAEYIPTLGQTEEVQIRCLGYTTKLALDILTEGSTIKKSYSSEDVGAILRDIINNFRGKNPDAPITVDSTSCPDISVTASLTLDSSTYLDAVTEVIKLAGADYYWILDTDNKFYLKQFSTSADHLFIFKRDIASINAQNSITQLRNGIYFWNGEASSDPNYINKLYKDDASIIKYGRQFEKKRDERYTVSGTADLYGNRFVDVNKDPFNNVSIKVIDGGLVRGYDIESIKPGDTCRVLNLNENNILTDNMIITKVNYSWEFVDLDIDDANIYIDRVLYELNKEILELSFGNDSPDTYTT